MTILELYERLKEKGYEGPKDGVEVGPGWLCYPDCLKQALELDRREVFRVWFHEGEGQRNHGKTHLFVASAAYGDGKLNTCIDYLLQNP